MTTPSMRTLIETMVMDRTRDVTGNPPPRVRKPKGEGNGPSEGVYWMRGSVVFPISGTTNEIVSLAGQVVMIDPEKFGLSKSELLSALKVGGEGQYSPVQEYTRYLEDPSVDLSHGAYLWKSSKMVYDLMLKNGWAWVKYNPPSSIHFAMIPSAVKRQLASAAEHFSLLQIDDIKVTLIEEFSSVNTKYPHLSKNKTLTFSKTDIAGFAGVFGGVLDWSNGKEAPSSNYMYLVTSRPQSPLFSSQANVKIDGRYLKRWAFTLKNKESQAPEGKYLIRIPVSIVNKIYSFGDRGLTPVNQKGERTVYSDKLFDIPASNFEVMSDGKWIKASELKFEEPDRF